jgi:DNA-binding response OmpR family regulator
MYNCEVDPQVREMIDKHIDRLRRKLRNTGLYVYCILGYGYLLLNVDSSSPRAEGQQDV